MAPSRSTKHKVNEIKDTERPRLSNFFRNLPPNLLSRGPFCFEWKGFIAPDGYGRHQVHIDLKNGTTYKKNWRVHRWAYFAYHQDHRGFDDEHRFGVSHLCGNKVCANPAHLTYEEQNLNIKRIKCHDQGVCDQNHGSHPDCIFENQ